MLVTHKIEHMTPGTIIHRGISKKDREFFIRSVQIGDAPLMAEYLNALSAEQTFVTFQGEKITLEDEEKYVNSQLKKMEIGKGILLLCFCEDKLIGVAGVDLGSKTESHVGTLGISLAKEYRGEGIGKVFMQFLLAESENNLQSLKIITLGVFANNSLAIHMYKSLGFKEYGILPKGIQYKGEYIDDISMYKFVNEFAE